MEFRLSSWMPQYLYLRALCVLILQIWLYILDIRMILSVPRKCKYECCRCNIRLIQPSNDKNSRNFRNFCLVYDMKLFNGPHIKDGRANCFCASLLRKVARTSIEGALINNKWTVMAQMTIVTALPGFNGLGRSVPLIFLTDHFLYRFSTFSEKMKKIYRLKVGIFCEMHHRIPSFLISSSFICQAVSNASWGVTILEKALSEFGIINSTDSLIQNIARTVCLS